MAETRATKAPTADHLLLLAPALFVLLWSTGWLSARYIVGVVEPLTFLLWRYALSALVLAALVQATGAAWPTSRRQLAHMLVSGVMIQALYLGSVWWAVANGVPAGLSGLIAALQPIFTALLAPAILGERITRRQWGGIGLALAGISLVLSPKLRGLDAAALRQASIPIAINIVGMLSVTLGTFYQKKFIPTANLLTSTAVQNIGALVATLPLAILTETLVMRWTPVTIAVMAWSVVGLSIGATMLFFWMVRRGAVTRAASLIYLMPPAVAVEAYLLFGENLTKPQIFGLLVTVVGVALAVKR
jgi:drug/metabolite transporter (DMT)-like permease